MKLDELVQHGFEEADVGSFNGLGSLEIFNQVKKVINYLSRLVGNLEDSPDFPRKSEYIDDLNETLYSTGQLVCWTYCDKKFKSTGNLIFKRVEGYLLKIKESIDPEYHDNFNLFFGSLKNAYRKRNRIGLPKIKGNRFKFRE